MSLISGANFASPLRSKVQIGMILVLAVLVAVIRFAGSQSAQSGGDFDSASLANSRQSGESQQLVDPEIENFLASRRRGRLKEPAVAPGDVTVEDLLKGGGNNQRPRAVQEVDSEDESEQPEKLNDIKRSLGMD